MEFFMQKYEPLGVNRVDLCCLDFESHKQTELNINEINQDFSCVKFNPVDFSKIFHEEVDNSYGTDIVDKILDKQMELKPALVDVQLRLLQDPDFFFQTSTSEIKLEVFESIFM